MSLVLFIWGMVANSVAVSATALDGHGVNMGCRDHLHR